MKIIIVLAILLAALFFAPRFVYPQELPDIKTYSVNKVLDKWGSGQWTYFNTIIERESHWDHNAQNPNSSAYGLGQLLNSTWDDVDCVKTSDPYKQIDCIIFYIEMRYDTPYKAKIHHDKKGWY